MGKDPRALGLLGRHIYHHQGEGGGCTGQCGMDILDPNPLFQASVFSSATWGVLILISQGCKRLLRMSLCASDLEQGFNKQELLTIVNAYQITSPAPGYVFLQTHTRHTQYFILILLTSAPSTVPGKHRNRIHGYTRKEGGTEEVERERARDSIFDFSLWCPATVPGSIVNTNILTNTVCWVESIYSSS